MSWLSNLAKQGEAFLDNLDQQAGSAIENVEKKVKEKVKDTRTTTPVDNAMDRSATHHRSLQNVAGISRGKFSPVQDRHSRSSSRDKRREMDSPRDSPILNRSSSFSSRLSSQDRREIEDVHDGVILRRETSGFSHNSKPPTPPSGRNSPRDTSESEFELVSGPGSVVGKEERVSRDEAIDLQLENRLLRQEMNSLNLEISRLIDIQRKTDRELELANQELNRRKRRNISESEHHSSEMESVLKEREASMREMDAKETQFESEKTSLSEALSKAQICLQQEKTRAQELSGQCRTYKTSMDSLQHDFEDYKTKSTRILQSKEKLISSLKLAQGTPEPESGDFSSLNVELEEMRNDNEFLKEENRGFKTQIENLRADLVQVESQAAEDYELISNKVFDLELMGEEDKRIKSELEEDLSRSRLELRQALSELQVQKEQMRQRQQSKDKEISKLRGQVINRASDSELEKRLRALTETLIEKQTTIEGLSSDKSSLGLELERIKAERGRQQYSNSYRSSTGLRKRGAGEYDEEALVTDNTDDAVGKIKRAVGALDKLSIRLGVLLKRYPTVRLLVIVYMIVLHVWTSVVLVTYEPEMHGSNFPEHPEPHHAAKQFQPVPLPVED